MLFYLNGLAGVSRAKEYNDFITPHFPKGFRAPEGSFGDGLTEHFRVDGNDSYLGKFVNAVNSKRTYTWSILGDWTLRLRYVSMPIAKFKKPQLAVWPLPPNQWLVTDQFETVKILPDREQAERMLAAIKHYDLTERYVIGDDFTGWEYYLDDGTPPRAKTTEDVREESFQIDADELSVSRTRIRVAGVRVHFPEHKNYGAENNFRLNQHVMTDLRVSHNTTFHTLLAG